MKQQYANRKTRTAILLLPALLVMGLTSFSAEAADGLYQVMKHNLPKTVEPGQQLAGQVTLKVIAPGTLPYTRPFASLNSEADPKRSLNLPGDKMIPWHFPEEQKPGDILNLGFQMDIPLDFPIGAANIGVVMTRHPEGRGWESADFQDEKGAALGTTFSWPLKVAKEDTGLEEQNVSEPFVVKKISRPEIDGRVQEEEWKQANRIEKFVESTSGGVPKAPSKAYVGYDDKTLYVAVIFEEPMMDKASKKIVRPGRDAGHYANECVELFVNPQADRASYMHFLLDILNQRYDALGSDYYGYNPAWETAVFEGTTFWSAEMAIPFSSLGVAPPELGAFWFANVGRERWSEQELSGWKPTFGQFASPGRFGMWVFGSLTEHLSARVSSIAAKKMVWPDELGGKVSAWSEKLAALQNRISGMDEAEAISAYPRMVFEIEQLDNAYQKFCLKAMQLKSGAAFVVAQSWPYEPFKGTQSDLDWPVAPVEVTLLQDEWVDLAWNITNLSDKPVVLRCTTRHGKGGEPTEYRRLGLKEVDSLWQQATPVAASDGRPMYDVISPRVDGVIHVPAGGTAQAWLSIHAPKDATGSAAGRIMIQAVDGSEGDRIEVPLKVNFVPVCLTEKPEVHCFTWNILNVKQDSDVFAAHMRDLKAHGVDMCFLSGATLFPRPKANADGTLPAGKMDFSKVDPFLDATMDLFDEYYIGIDIIAKGSVDERLIGLNFDTPAYEKAFKSWFGQILEHLLSRGLTHDRMMFNPVDESVNERCQEIARWMKEVDPNTRIVIDCSTHDLEEGRKMDALTDVWMPHFKAWRAAESNKPFFELLRTSGKPLWCYFYSEGSNEKAQDPTRHYLAKFWWAFSENITGVGYWAQQYYGDPWYRKDFPGAYDTSLVYPIEGGMVPSRRWQAWRRGWQDYCLLVLTRKHFKQAEDEESLAKLNELVKKVAAVPGDPTRAEKARLWLKKTLERRND